MVCVPFSDYECTIIGQIATLKNFIPFVSVKVNHKTFIWYQRAILVYDETYCTIGWICTIPLLHLPSHMLRTQTNRTQLVYVNYSWLIVERCSLIFTFWSTIPPKYRPEITFTICDHITPCSPKISIDLSHVICTIHLRKVVLLRVSRLKGLSHRFDHVNY